MSKWIPWFLFCSAFIAAVYVFVLLLNAGSAMDDARSETERIRVRSDLALSIIRNDWLGKKETSVIALSNEMKRKGVIVGIENGLLEIGDLIFAIENGIVIDVHYID